MSSSLTAPWDRTEEEQTYKPKQIVLSENEVSSALNELYIKDFTNKFPRVDRFYADPVLNSQVYCLHSFVPSKGAKPDDRGVYGFVKFRGSFATQQEADERAEFLVRNVDSFNDVYTSYCGRPFPLTHNKAFVKETSEIDVKKQISDIVSKDIKTKVAEERRIKDELKEKEKKLLEENDKVINNVPVETDEERYTVLQVKRANLVHVYVETNQKLEKIKESILKCRSEIEQFDETHPEIKDTYIEKYNQARELSGLDKVENDTSYLKYMGYDDKEVLGF